MNYKYITIALAMSMAGWGVNALEAPHTATGSNQWTAALPTNTQENNSDDTIDMYRITFSKPIAKVMVTGYCNLTIVGDTADFLSYSRPSNYKTLSYDLTSSGVLKLNGLPSSRKLELHLDMGSGLDVETNDFSNVVMYVDKELSSLDIETNDYSNVTVRTKLDTVRATTVTITTNDFSNAKFDSPLSATTARLRCNDYSNAKLENGKVTKIYESQSEYGTLKYGRLGDGTIYEDFDMDALAPTERKPVQKKSTPFFHDGGWTFGFAWAFNNWGRTPWSGLNPMSGPYGLGTTFSSYQLELVFYPLCTRHFKFGLGLGYGSNIYRFSDNYVTLTAPQDGKAGDLTTIDRQDADWSSRMVARYVTMPISIVWKPAAHSDFSIGLAAIPGVNYASRHTGLKHKGLSADNNGKVTNVENMSTVMNPLQLDARLSLNFSMLSVFIQMATQPVMLNMGTDVYPIKLGFILNLGDD